MTAPVVVGSVPDAELDLAIPPHGLPVPEERAHRKRELAAAFRVFGRFGFSEGVAGQHGVGVPAGRAADLAVVPAWTKTITTSGPDPRSGRC